MSDFVDYRQSMREPSNSYSRPMDPMRRSITRGSHYSHGSVSASTRSWVYSTQQNPPLPPGEVLHTPTPLRASRPLPDPQRHSQLYAVNASEPEEEDEEEYMNIDANAPGVDYGYQDEGLGRGRVASPPPMLNDIASGGNKSFVGGFFSSLRKIPRALRIGSTSTKKRRGTATDGTVTSATGMTTGNTLPLYASNPPTPVAPPQNVQFPEAHVPIPRRVAPPHVPSPLADHLRRTNPSFRVTPPSDGLSQDGTAHQYDYVGHSTPHFTDNPSVPLSPAHGERTTVMMYQDQQDPVPTEPVPQVGASRLSRISYAPAQSPSQVIRESTPAPVQSPDPVSAHPLPAADYRKMMLSPGPTSRATVTTITSYDEPSFTTELNPVPRFFHTLYNMPWVSQDRTTVDYRPGKGAGGQSGGRGVIKKPASSWYKKVKAGADVDLLSDGVSPRTSMGTNATTPLSPTTGRVRSKPATGHHARHSTHNHHPNRRHRRRTVTSTTTFAEVQHQRASSPLIPPVYPFQYPAYPYPYGGYPPLPPPQAAHTPRGPRSHRRPSYPQGGYTPYPPLPPPPAPVFVLQSPAQSNGSGDGGGGQQIPQGQMLSPVYMQLVPGGFTSPPSSPIPAPAPVQTA
ncbi:hypothetical protein BDQ12DRAFT_749718 [Crucibulum laeve]|uniref:Uncharacterized protein n=1 Tax=Crucibulum laeve TaxID=68775 RepID=A0A5C3LYU7_9AGAR|nr:hypothetical protein BDQ12DRAFT_749718 [Crucibulum laeve]